MKVDKNGNSPRKQRPQVSTPSTPYCQHSRSYYVLFSSLKCNWPLSCQLQLHPSCPNLTPLTNESWWCFLCSPLLLKSTPKIFALFRETMGFLYTAWKTWKRYLDFFMFMILAWRIFQNRFSSSFVNLFYLHCYRNSECLHYNDIYYPVQFKIVIVFINCLLTFYYPNIIVTDKVSCNF